MKIYPSAKIKSKAAHEQKTLSTIEKITRVIALLVAFITVYLFFFKILFF